MHAIPCMYKLTACYLLHTGAGVTAAALHVALDWRSPSTSAAHISLTCPYTYHTCVPTHTAVNVHHWQRNTPMPPHCAMPSSSRLVSSRLASLCFANLSIKSTLCVRFLCTPLIDWCLHACRTTCMPHHATPSTTRHIAGVISTAPVCVWCPCVYVDKSSSKLCERELREREREGGREVWL